MTRRTGSASERSTLIGALLGLKPFTPHDLRRTAATLAGDLGFDDAWIAKCLDHAASKKQEQIVPSVTGKVYNHSKRMKEKRACWMALQPSCGGSLVSRRNTEKSQCVLPLYLRHKSLSKFRAGQLDKLTGLLFDA